MKSMKVLAFETSCDETSAAVVTSGFKVSGLSTRTQLEHSRFGGVVPEIASRAHTRYILPSALSVLEQAQIDINDIDGIAATYGPGLIGALLVGLTFAKTLSQVLDIPFIGINHLEGHLYSIFLEDPTIEPPVLYLLVSGGHTELIVMEEFFRYKVLGTTLDDACGEAFDKGAKLLGLPYPGGPEIDRLSQKGDPNFHRFPRAKVGGFDFSFSGIKTALLYYLRDHPSKFIKENISHIAASYQEALVDMLIEKLWYAIERTGLKKVAIVGGVTRNSRLRQRLVEEFQNVDLIMPQPLYCIDNAAMVGAAAIKHFEAGHKSELSLPAIPDLTLA